MTRKSGARFSEKVMLRQMMSAAAKNLLRFLGATAFVPLSTTRSVVQPRETKLDKLQRYVIEASKQCGRNVLMEVYPLREWSAFSRDAQLP